MQNDRQRISTLLNLKDEWDFLLILRDVEIRRYKKAATNSLF